MDIVVIGVIAALLQAALLVALIWRGQVRRFPFFVAYTAFSILAILLNVAMRQNSRSYFLSAVATELVYGTLALFAIREAFRDALESDYSRGKWSQAVPFLLLVGVIGVPVWKCFYHPRVTGIPLEACLYSGTYAFRVCIAALELFVLLLLLYLTWVMEYRWRRYNRAIITGFGIYGLITLFSVVLETAYDTTSASWLRYLSPGAYFGATLYWLSAFLSQRDIPLTKRPPDEKLLDQLHDAITQAHRDLHNRHEDDAL